MWQRHAVAMLFDFEYTWEVYVPAAKRKYGYYVLPVLYGEQLIARMDPKFHRDKGVLVINGWWWQPDAKRKDEAMLAAIQECFAAFGAYLQASEIRLGPDLKREAGLRKLIQTVNQALSPSNK